MLNESMMRATNHSLKQAQIELNPIKHNNSLPHETRHILRWNKRYGLGHSIICKNIYPITHMMKLEKY
jgi:hypothetical protein